MDTILGIPPGESYSGIRMLVDLSMCVKYTNTHVLVVVEICAIIFVLVGFSSSPNLFLGFGIDLRSWSTSASRE